MIEQSGRRTKEDRTSAEVETGAAEDGGGKRSGD
jgi:hypothetical protein